MLYFERKSLSFETAFSYIQAFTSNSHEFLWKRSSLFQNFNSLWKVNRVLLHFLNAILSEKITFLWNCLKLLTSIHQQLTCISLKEKQSVPTLQFSVRIFSVFLRRNNRDKLLSKCKSTCLIIFVSTVHKQIASSSTIKRRNKNSTFRCIMAVPCWKFDF